MKNSVIDVDTGGLPHVLPMPVWGKAHHVFASGTSCTCSDDFMLHMALRCGALVQDASLIMSSKSWYTRLPFVEIVALTKLWPRARCGTFDDGCGGEITCGGRPKTCNDYPGKCGLVKDGCGGDLICGKPKTCADYHGKCGEFSDGCGGTIKCGCSSDRTCCGKMCVARCGRHKSGYLVHQSTLRGHGGCKPLCVDTCRAVEHLVAHGSSVWKCG